MAQITIKYLVLRRGRQWWTKFLHPVTRKSIYNATGHAAGDVAGAMKFSAAITTFITDPAWHDPSKYGLARQLHEPAAKIFYGPMKPSNNFWFASRGLYVCRPQEFDDGTWTEELEQIEVALQNAEVIRGENKTFRQRVAELETENAALRSTLGHTISVNKPFAAAADEYRTWGAMQGGRGGRPWSEHHKRKREEHLRFWAAKFEFLSDVRLSAVEAVLQELMTGRAGKTVASYREALCALCDWSLKRGYFTSDPLTNLGLVDATPERVRRALMPEEITALLENCVPSRRIVYEVALCSGLRANELRSLKVKDVDAGNCGLKLSASWTKNRKRGFQVVPRWLIDKLKLLLDGREPDSPLLTAMPVDTSDTFEVDRERAKIAKDLDGVVDFHALRTTFATLVDGTGASAKTTQELSRHSSPSMTFGRYAKARSAEMSATAEAVGAVVRAG